MVKEKRRAKLVAMLHGYTPMETDATRDSLIAEYEALMGEPYRTREEEASEAREVTIQRGKQRKIDQLAADLLAIKEATAKGFMNSMIIVRTLFPDRFPDRPVKFDAAYRWMRNVELDVVYIVPDGITDVRKSERTGCWASDFPKILAYKTAYYQQIAVNDWTRNVEGALAAWGIARGS